MKQFSVEQVVGDWLAASGKSGRDSTMAMPVGFAPEIAWKAIQQLSALELSDEQKALLAAGPLESLLFHHGQSFIDRVEEAARSSERFNHLLGGVWQGGMRKDIWRRVEAARRCVW